MKFDVTLCNSDNACVWKFIDAVKKSKPDCTIMRDELKVKTHKMLLQVFSDKFADFEEKDSPVIVLYDHNAEVIKTVISDLLYYTTVVVEEERLKGIQSLCKLLGIKIDVVTIGEPVVSADSAKKELNSSRTTIGKKRQLTATSKVNVEDSDEDFELDPADDSDSSAPSNSKRRKTMPPLRYRAGKSTKCGRPIRAATCCPHTK